MPRAFTDEEHASIRARLLEAGRAAFARAGLRGTTVEELARAAAISKGAFYRFFDGKEALLIALLTEHEQAEHARLEAAIRSDPAAAGDVLVDGALQALDRAPFLAVIGTEEGRRALLGLTEEEREALADRDRRTIHRVAELLRQAELVLPLPEEALLGLLRTLVLTAGHRDDLGDAPGAAMTAWLKDELRPVPAPGTEEEP